MSSVPACASASTGACRMIAGMLPHRARRAAQCSRHPTLGLTQHSSDRRCSTVGLGNGGGCHPDPDGTERNCSSYKTTTLAISAGYRAFHDALSYCNQAGLGAAVADSKIKRSELFLMSMVPTYLMGYNETIASVHASLEQMRLTQLDLVMIHHRAPVNAFPRLVSPMKAFPSTPVVSGKASWGPPPCAVADPSWVSCQTETWDALIELKKQGKVRAIGVSNWEIATIQRMIDRGVELPAVNQIETVRPTFPHCWLYYRSIYLCQGQLCAVLYRCYPPLLALGVVYWLCWPRAKRQGGTSVD